MSPYPGKTERAGEKRRRRKLTNVRDLEFLAACVSDDDGGRGLHPATGQTAAAKRLEARGFLISDPSVRGKLKRYKATERGERFALVFIAMLETM